MKYNKEYYDLLNQKLEAKRKAQLESENYNDNCIRKKNKILQENYNAMNKINESVNNKMNKINSIREFLLNECINDLYSRALVVDDMNIQNNNIKSNIIHNFIKEQGCNNLINSFKTKNYILSEYYRIINKYTDIITESNKDCNTIEVDPQTKDNFYKEIDTDNVDTAARVIKNRVKNEIEEFIDQNAKEQVNIKELIDKSSEKINSAKTDIAKEAAEMTLKGNIFKMRNNNKPKNIFNYMVSELAESAYSNPDLKRVYCNESGKLNVDSIVENVETIYTFLEMVNTTNMINVDKKYIWDTINDLKK